MAIFKIVQVDNKSNDWKIVTLISSDNVTLAGVSVNRVNKKNETFPSFDDIQAGKEVDGNLWTSSAGKNYLFAPDIKKTYKTFQGAGKSAVVEKAMDRKESFIERSQLSKEESIKQSQDRTSHAVMVASSFKMAEELLIATEGTIDTDTYLSKLLKIRYELVKHWNDIEQPKSGEVDYPQAGVDAPNPEDVPW